MMKTIIKSGSIFFSVILILMTYPACTQGFEKLPENQTDKSQIELAKNFADNYFSALKDGKYYEFHDEATEALKKALTPEAQQQVYQNIKSQFGDYQSLEYIETWKSSDGEILTIVRLKSTFDPGKEKPEVRIVLNEDNKIAGFWIKPWEEMLK